MNEKYNAYVRSVADYFIEEMKKGTAPWQQDWDNAANVVPVSAVTDAPYRGTNALLLMAVRMSQGYGDNRWLTFRQVQELGGKVKKGEHGTKCIFWKHLVEKDEKDEDKTVERLIPCPFVVFNSEQCENLNLKKFETPVHEWTPLEAAERILDKSGAKIKEIKQNQSYYVPALDKIVLPLRTQFKDAEGFYATALHELGHWTGHSSRLNRPILNKFGTPDYAREELRAEISSMMVCGSLGIKHKAQNSAAYVSNWIDVLKKDPKELFRACADAEKIKDYLFGIDKSLGLTAEPPVKKDKSPDNKEAKAALQTAALQTYKDLPNYQQKYIQSSMLNYLTQPLSNPYQFQKPSQKIRSIDIER